LAILAKFQKKLSSAKERAQETSDDKANQSSPDLDDKTKDEDEDIDDDDDW
jgi:hypothetical protein